MSFWSRIERRIEELAGELIPDEFRERLARARRLLRDGEVKQAEEELSRLAIERPGQVRQLEKKWLDWATRANVLPKPQPKAKKAKSQNKGKGV